LRAVDADNAGCPIYYSNTTNRPTTSNGHTWTAGSTATFYFDGANWRYGGDAETVSGVDTATHDSANYISATSEGIKIANEDPSSATTYQLQTAEETSFYVNGKKRLMTSADGTTLYSKSEEVAGYLLSTKDIVFPGMDPFGNKGIVLSSYQGANVDTLLGLLSRNVIIDAAGGYVQIKSTAGVISLDANGSNGVVAIDGSIDMSGTTNLHELKSCSKAVSSFEAGKSTTVELTVSPSANYTPVAVASITTGHNQLVIRSFSLSGTTLTVYVYNESSNNITSSTTISATVLCMR
jgi:hypothetical protein